ncbi:hypothetical protein MK280_10770, partial [Myxococcota bacterium]|nr:hypothetical protein [Myxococcota bacterium]
VTFARTRRLARGLGIHWGRRGAFRRVLIGFDTRLASEALACCVSDILHEAGFEPILSREAVPTPVLTHAVRRRRVAGGVMLTASHNAPLDHGVKVFGPTGGALAEDEVRQLEGIVSACDGRQSPEALPRRRINLIDPYIRHVRTLLDEQSIQTARVRVVYDAMHGTGANLLPRLFDSIGVRADSLNTNLDPGFGGRAPDPIPDHIGDLIRCVGKEKAGHPFGLATDGDGDRLTVVLRGGRILSETEMAALLVDYLAESGRLCGGVAVTQASGSLIGRVAGARGLELIQTPIGFKFLAPLLDSKRIAVAADESGGFAWSRMGIDKDGLMAAALFCEMASVTPRGVEGRLQALEAEHGPSYCGRGAVPQTGVTQAGFRRLHRVPPAKWDGRKVLHVHQEDGLRLTLEDGFVMWRGSGTEPVFRVYAEAKSKRRLGQRLRLAEQLLMDHPAAR